VLFKLQKQKVKVHFYPKKKENTKMKKIKHTCHRYITVVVLLVCMNGLLFAQKHYKEITFPKLPDIKVPKVDQVTLSNGMKLFLLEDHELPIMNLRAMLKTGSVYEPLEKIGLADITGTVLRTGGTTTRTGDEIDEILESIAASVETWVGETSGGAYMSVLKQDIDTGFDILSDILMNPVFNQDKIDLAKVEQRSIIARRNDQVSQIAGREFNKLIYGEESVYARHPEYATIDAITREDLIEFHKEYYHPNNIMLGVWGDFNKKALIKKIESIFKNWEKADLNIPPVPAVNYEFKPTVNLILKEDVNQTNIYMGHIGGRRDNPDYFSMILMNRILGIGFTSRLFKSVRSRQGLAYSVFGVYTADYDHAGVLYVGCQTKSESTVKATLAMYDEVKKMTESEVSDEELAIAKDAYLNSFVFNFDSKGEIVSRLMTYDYYGYPADFLQKTKTSIENVTKADILRVSKKYLHYDAMQILAVGNPADFDEPLSVLGEVNKIDITIPVEEEAVPEATETTLLKGRKILENSIQASGGKSAFKAIETIRWKGDLTAITPQGEMNMGLEILRIMPDKMRANVQTPMGSMSQIMNGEDAWMISPQGTTPAPPQMKTELAASIWRNISFLFPNSDMEGLEVQYLESGKVQGENCEVLLISPPDVKSFKLYVNAETSVPVMFSYQGTNMMGAPTASEEIFSDFREVAGVKLPFKAVTNQDGKKAQETIAKEIVINVEIPEGQFNISQ
jgi:predicted Zn-dependent peptidase